MDAILFKLRAAIDQAEAEFLRYTFTMNVSWENWAFQYSEACQRKIDAAQQHAKFVLRDQNEEVLLVNSLLRRELEELRNENEAYKQELMLRDQSSAGG